MNEPPAVAGLLDLSPRRPAARTTLDVLVKNTGPGAYCPNHQTGVKLPGDFVVKPLQYVD